MAGYSGTTLAKKLGIKPSHRLYVENAPDHYLTLVEPLPEGATVVPRLTGATDMIHLFTKEARELESKLETYLQRMADDTAIWISWPKKAAKVATDVTEDVIRAIALPLGLVDIKVCAVDETWSGLKLVIRLANRKTRTS